MVYEGAHHKAQTVMWTTGLIINYIAYLLIQYKTMYL